MVEQFKEVSKESLLNKRAKIAKQDPSEEIIELHFEIQEFEKQFKELVDISGFLIKKNKELDDVIKSEPSYMSRYEKDGLFRKKSEEEKNSLLEQVRLVSIELGDYKERYRDRKSRCVELESLALSRHERA